MMGEWLDFDFHENIFIDFQYCIDYWSMMYSLVVTLKLKDENHVENERY